MNAKNSSIVSLVCGIVGIVGSWIPYVGYIAPLAAIAGIIFGALALKKLKEEGTTEGKGLAMAGLILGIVSTAISVICLVCTVCALCVAGNVLAGYLNS